jgi:hypothetical protein
MFASFPAIRDPDMRFTLFEGLNITAYRANFEHFNEIEGKN